MSVPDQQCAVCGKTALAIPGWDNGFPSYRNFRAVWDPPRVLTSMIHFACLRTWTHRDAFVEELLTLVTDKVERYEIQHEGAVYPVSRQGLGYTEVEYDTRDILVLRNRVGARWMVIDRTGGWQELTADTVRALAHGQIPDLSGGFGRYGILLPPSARGDDAPTWTLTQLLDRLEITDRYPGLDDATSSLLADDYHPATGRLTYETTTPAHVPAEAVAHFARRLAELGPTAFDPRPLPG